MASMEEIWRELRQATGLTFLSPEANEALYEFMREHVGRYDNLDTNGWSREAREDYLEEVGAVIDDVRSKQEDRFNAAIKKQSQELHAVGAKFSRLITDLGYQVNVLDDRVDEFDDPELDLEDFKRGLATLQDECVKVFEGFCEARDELLEQVAACAESMTDEIQLSDVALSNIETHEDVRQIVEDR